MRVDPTTNPKYDLIMSMSAAILDAERDMDKSIVALSTLVSKTIGEFAEAELPASMSQRALEKLAAAIGTNVDSRRLLGEAHREYGRTAKMLGATAEDWGPWWPCPSGKTDNGQRVTQPLRVVA